MNKFEFLLKINGHIICQRYFNVKYPNMDVIKSMDMYWTTKTCVAIIEKDLKNKSEDYLWNSHRPYDTSDPIKRVDDKGDEFTFEIMVGGKVVMSQIFSGKPYPQRIRYSVDIRKIIPEIIEELQELFSEENLTVEFCGTVL
jgi:hypothetical protein